MMVIDPVWKGWRYTTDAESKSAYDRILRLVDQREAKHADIGLWRSSTPDRSEFYLIAAGDEQIVTDISSAVHPGVEWDVPMALRGPLWARHIMTVAAEYDRTGVPQVDVRQHHSGGRFLHRDGELHPFPEPSGQG